MPNNRAYSSIVIGLSLFGKTDSDRKWADLIDIGRHKIDKRQT